MSSIRRSHRSRGGGGGGGISDVGSPDMGQEDDATATSDLNGSPNAEEGLRRGKRKRNSLDGIGNNGQGENGTGDSGDEDSSSLRTRSSRKIVVKSVSTGRPAKTARGESVDGDADGEAAGAGRNNGLGVAHTSTSNGSMPVLDDAEWEIKSEGEQVADLQGSTNDQPSSEAALTDADAKTVHVLVTKYAPELLKIRPQAVFQPVAGAGNSTEDQGLEHRKRGAAERRAKSTETLEDILYSPVVYVRKLRDHLRKLQAPLVTPAALRSHLSGSHIVPPRTSLEADRKKIMAINTVISIVDEIARRDGLKRDPSALDSSPVLSQYALSLRLPIGDYFTSAVALTRTDAAAMDTGLARLLDVSTSHKGRFGTSDDSIDVPSIGDRLRRGIDNRPLYQPSSSALPYMPRRVEDGEFAKPSSHLYYNPWSSFAPKYDSFDGQLSYSASAALWRSKRDDRATTLARIRAKPSILGLEARQSLKEELETLSGDKNGEGEGWDIAAILAGYDTLPDIGLAGPSAEIADADVILGRNAVLLSWLHQLQEQRWQQLLAKYTLRRGGPELTLAEPDENERAIASHLYDSLVRVLSVQPRNVADEGERSALLPSAETLRALAASSAIDPALLDQEPRPGVWGSLDEHLFGPTASRRIAISRSAPPVRPVAAIRDDETCRLPPEQEEKIGAHLSLPSQTMHPGRVRAKGLLDTFAASRSYSIVDHPHDRKPPVPPQPGQNVRPGAPIIQAANSSASPHGLRTPSQAGVPGNASPVRSASRDQTFNRLGTFPQSRPGPNFPPRSGGQTVSYARPPFPGSGSATRFASGHMGSGWNAGQQVASMQRR